MRIAKGEYPIPSHNLTLSLQGDLEIGSQCNAYLLNGENGVGKTTFLEHVLMPALERQKLPFLYLGQDVGLQLYTLRASLAVVGHGLASLGESEVIRLWLSEGKRATVCVLDEFDKYLPDFEPLLREGAKFVRTFVLVSHGSMDCVKENLPDYQAYHLPFRLVSQESGVRRVNVSVQAWS